MKRHRFIQKRRFNSKLIYFWMEYSKRLRQMTFRWGISLADDVIKYEFVIWLPCRWGAGSHIVSMMRSLSNQFKTRQDPQERKSCSTTISYPSRTHPGPIPFRSMTHFISSIRNNATTLSFIFWLKRNPCFIPINLCFYKYSCQQTATAKATKPRKKTKWITHTLETN